MKNNIIFAYFVMMLACVMVSNVSNAQNGHGGHGNYGNRQAEQLERMTKDLSLTSAQQEMVKAAIQERDEKAEAARKLSDEQSKKAAFDTAQSEFDASMKGILNNDQYTKFKAKEAEMKKGRPQGSPQGRK